MQELQKMAEERKRLDRLRDKKFKIIQDAMAKVKIDEKNSEYNESVLNSFALGEKRTSSIFDSHQNIRI